MKSAVSFALSVAFLAAGLVSVARADGTPPAPTPGGKVAWASSLAEAFGRAKKDGIPVFIAINSQRVDGGREEPAAKELRENTYLDPAVVEKSKKFACALLRSDGSSADFGELRARFSIDGEIVSPQHLFAFPDDTLLKRYEYWPWGTGQGAVDKLLSLMDEALKETAARAALGGLAPPAAGTPSAPGASAPPSPGAPTPPDAPKDPSAPAPSSAEAQRAEWLRKTLDMVRTAKDAVVRDLAIRELIKNDQKGDCIEPLATLLLDLGKDPLAQVAILKALGKPGLEIVVPFVTQLLDAHDDEVRSNAAVTLEYVGSVHAVEALSKRLGRDRDEAIANNVARALGRCGAKAKDEAVRKALAREMNGAKNAKGFAGPVIGLAYDEKDADAARAIEKALKKEGDRVKRGLLVWALTEIKDPKSAEFLRTEVLAPEKDMRVSLWVRACAELIEGKDDPEHHTTIDGGMRFVMGGIAGVIGGPARDGRDQTEFKPKGEFGGGRGRGPGGPGGPPPADPGMNGGMGG